MLGQLTYKNKQRKELDWPPSAELYNSNCSWKMFVPNQVKFTHSICLSVTAGAGLLLDTECIKGHQRPLGDCGQYNLNMHNIHIIQCMKMALMQFANSVCLDQPAHSHRQIWTFIIHLQNQCILYYTMMNRDQTTWMCMLIWTLAGHIWHDSPFFHAVHHILEGSFSIDVT